MIFSLLIVLISQFNNKYESGPRTDLLFAASQEEWIQQVKPNFDYPFKELINQLGSDTYQVRKFTSEALYNILKKKPNEVRFLFWGRRSLDPEISLRCNNLLRKLNPCESCKGTGRSKQSYIYSCYDCDGSGTYWFCTQWD